MKILVDLRPAFAAHAGIPQEARLLFQALTQLDGVRADGLLQSGNRLLPAAVESSNADRTVQCLELARVLAATGRPRQVERARAALAWIVAIAASALGRDIVLGHADTAGYESLLWRLLFDRTLPQDVRDSVLGAHYRVLRLPWSTAHIGGLLSGRLGRACYPSIDTSGYGAVIAQTPFPGRVRAPTSLVIRYHDTVPLAMPDTLRMGGYDREVHERALRRNLDDGAWFACVSDATRKALLAIHPQAEQRTVTIPNILAPQFADATAEAGDIGTILRQRTWDASAGARASGTPAGCPAPTRAVGVDGWPRAGVPPFLLMVATIEPRKNHDVLLDAWQRLRASAAPDLRLVLVGAPGWRAEGTITRLRALEAEGGLHLLAGVPSVELRTLYRHAAATVCPSRGEGFGYTGLEAMASGGVVLASDIPAHREIYGDAAEFFDGASPEALAATIAPWLESGAVARRDHAALAGRRVAAQYRPSAILPRWRDFLDQVVGGARRPAGGNRSAAR